MDADLARLKAISATLRELPLIGQDVAEEAAPEVLKAARATAAAGTAPDGSAWAPTQEGERPLKNAAAAISVDVGGAREAVIVIKLRGHHVYHHYGVGAGRASTTGGRKNKRNRASKAKGGRNIPARKIIPEERLPPAVTEAIERAAASVRDRKLKGDR